MNITKEAMKLFNNKYFFYFIVFLTITNIISYLVNGKYNAIIFFALIYGLVYQFSKNRTIILLVALVGTSLLVSTRLIREGMSNESESESEQIKITSEKAGDIDPQIKAATDALNKTNDVEKAKQNLSIDSEKQDGPVKPSDPNNPDLNTSNEEGPAGVGSSSSKKGSGKSSSVPRLDYAATLEESYKNLDSILGGDSIQRLTTDTQKLMAQQQTLFNTMNKMVPVLEGAQNMLKGFDMNSLSKSLEQVGNLGNIKLPEMSK
jgi:hypothetical protein